MYAKEEERQKEDLDARVQGNLLHKVHHQLIEQILGVEENKERTVEEIQNDNFPLNIARSNFSDSELQSLALSILADLAPWLERLMNLKHSFTNANWICEKRVV